MSNPRYPDGTPIPDKDLARAQARGEVRFDSPDAPVEMVDEYGQKVTVPASQYAQTLRRGGRIRSGEELRQEQLQAEYGGAGGQAKALGIGLVEGVPVLGPAAVAGVAEATGTEDDVLALKEANPTANLVGNIASPIPGGALVKSAGMLAKAGKGGKALAKGAEATGRTLAAPHALAGKVDDAAALGIKALGGGKVTQRIGGMAAAGGVEGGLYAGGQEYLRQKLRGDELSGELILEATGEGMAFGAAAGGAFGALGAAAGKAVDGTRKVMGTEKVRGAAREIADTQTIKALGGTKRDFNKLSPKKVKQIADDVRSYRDKDGNPILRKGQKDGDQLDDLVAAERDLGKRLGDKRQELDELIGAPGSKVKVNFGEYLGRVDEKILKPLKSSDVPGIRRQAASVERELSTLRKAHESGEKITFARLENFRQELRKTFQPKAPASGGLPPPPPKAAEYLERAEREASAFLDEQAQKALKDAGRNPNEYVDLRRQYESIRKAKTIAEGAQSKAGNRSVSLTDYIAGLGGTMASVASGNITPLIMAGGGAVINKLGRERGSSWLALSADEVANKVAKSERSIDTSARVLAGIQKAIRAATGATARTAGSAPAPKSLADKRGEDLEKAYFAEIRKVQQFNQDPARSVADLGERLGPDLMNANPHIVPAALRKAEFLGASIPEALRTTSVTPHLEKPRVPAHEMRKFLRQVEALDSPTKVIERMASGKVDRESIEALKVASPHAFGKLREKVVMYLAEADEPLPFSKRVFLGNAFDIDQADASLDPARGAAMQQTHAEDPAQQPKRKPSGEMTKGEKETFVESNQSQSERLALGG